MELLVAIQKKEALETEINNLIIKFEKETKLKVSDVDFFKPIEYTGGFSVSYHTVTVKVEI